MASKGVHTKPPEWWKHLRWWNKRKFWKAERKAAKRDSDLRAEKDQL